MGPKEKDQKYTFILRPFEKPFDAFYQNNFIEIANKAGLPRVEDGKSYIQGTINEKVKNVIHQARLIIADVTLINPNVLWEAGYAEGIGKPIIYMYNPSYHNGSQGGVNISDLSGTEYIEYTFKMNGNNFEKVEEIQTAFDNIKHRWIKDKEIRLLTEEDMEHFINANHIIAAYLKIDHPIVLDVFKKIKDNTSNIIISFNNTDILTEPTVDSYFKYNGHIKITPLELFVDSLLISDNVAVFSINNSNCFWAINDPTLINNIKEYGKHIQNSTLTASDGYVLKKLANTIRTISPKEITAIKEYGHGFFTKSQYWYKTPTEILKKCFKEQSGYIKDLQNSINNRFYNFSQELLKPDSKISNIYLIWPLTYRQSIDLNENANIKMWLTMLNEWSKIKNKKVCRFIIIKGRLKDDHYVFDDKEQIGAIHKILTSSFSNCNYKSSIKIFIDDIDGINKDGYFSEEERVDEFLSQNSILFTTGDIINNKNELTGYLQKETKHSIEGLDMNLLEFLYINLLDGSREKDRYISKYCDLVRDNRNRLIGYSEFKEILNEHNIRPTELVESSN